MVHPRLRDAAVAPWVDVLAYAVSAVFAVLLADHTEFLLHRRWGSMAAPVYAGAALAAVVVSIAVARLGRPLVGVRMFVLAFVVVGAGLAPLAVNVDRRADRGAGGTVLSEAIVVEEAGEALAEGRDPYAEVLDDPALEVRHASIRERFPYLPAMAVFGLPRAAAGDGPLTDARVVFAAFTLAVAALAARALPGRLVPVGALLLCALPPGAFALSTGGDDIPVLVLLLVSVAFVAEGRGAPAGAAAGAAMACKQLAWPVAGLLGLYLLRRDRPQGWRMTAVSAAIVVPVLVPFLAWHPADFVDDVLRFPLGLTEVATVAASPTVGRIVTDLLPVGVVVVVAGLVVAAVLLAGATPWAHASFPRVVALAGLALGIAVLAAPATRYGLLAYPLNLATWAVIARS